MLSVVPRRLCTDLAVVAVIVCFTSLTDEERGKAAHIGIKPYSWNEFVEMVSVCILRKRPSLHPDMNNVFPLILSYVNGSM